MRGFRAIARVGLVLSVALATIACGGTKKKVGQLCQNDSTCPSGSLCVAGECVTLQACQSTSECEAGVCSEGYCWTEACSADRPCADSLQCLDGYCVRRAETQDASDTSSEDQSVTPDQGQEKQCDLDADCADKVGQLGQCEEAWCNAGQCQKRNKTSGASCDDGNKCTSGDQCDDAGSCQPGSNICECEKDGDCTQLTDACNTGVCNPTTNKCVKQPANEGKSCDDGTFCMVGEVCVNGTCGGNPEHKLRTDCGLNGATDQCNTARCDTVSDKCVVDPINEGNPCDDGNVCTVSDSCKSGVCAGDPLFGSSCGSGVGEHCDFYGQCVSWVETRLAPPTYSTNVACLAATDCPDGGNGYSCENGMCVCTNGAGCVCETGAPSPCGLGQVCLAIENVQAPSGKDFYCSAQYLRHSGVCRVPQKSGDDALYLVGINVTDYDYKLDIVFQQMENGGVIQTQIPVEDTWLAGSEVVMCSGPMAGMVVSGEGVDFYAFRLDDQLKWNEDDNIYEALANAGGAIVNGAPISLFSLTTTDDKLVTYWGGYFRSTSLQAPGESSPTSHKDFLVRCIDDSLSTTGYSCEPRFLKIHDGTTDIDNSDTLMPPYTDTTPAVTGIWGYWKGDVETLQTMTNIRVNFSGSADDFGYWLSNASVDGDVWGYDAPTGCIGWKGGTCDTFPSWELDYEYYSDWNRGMYSIDGMNGKTMIAASPKVPLFDSNNLSVNQNPDNAPNVAPLFYNDGTGFVALQYPTGALLKDAKHFDGAPYEFLFDHVRFLSDEQVLLVGHYRTCLTDGCYNTLDVENSVTVKTQPFLTTYNQTSKTFGPMIPIGSGFEQTCCTGPACQSVPNCLRYQMDAFWFGARILGVNLRKHANGVEIYMTQSPAVDSGQGYMTFARKPIVYSYLSIKP